MKIKKIHRRQLVAGGAASALLAALPLTGTSAKTNTFNATKFKYKNKLTAAIKAANLPNQYFSHVVYSRLGYGITPGIFDQVRWAALGSSDSERLANFVDQQLAGGNDTNLDNRINQAGNYVTLNKGLGQMWQDHHVNSGSGLRSSSRPIYEMERLKFLRATYTLFPLQERIADFWHDHFSLNGRSFYARSTMTSWDRDVIRTHMLGNFQSFLTATARHPAMLYYLDNYNNSVSEPNENYARELIELHTLGVENYFGLAEQDEVPMISVPERGGPWPSDGMIQEYYVDNDVYEATRCLTGWRVNDSSSNGDTGFFMYDDERHDRFQKSVLTGGQINIPANQGQTDGDNVLALLARHPGTAKHIAGKLARFFISDNPPQSLIDDVADVFYENRNAADQLKQVFVALFNHPEFSNPANWQAKLKRPFDTVVSAMRALRTNFTVKPDDDNSNNLEYRMDDTGHYPFEWQAPDGYPTKSSYWMSSTALIQTWKTVDWLIDRSNSGTYITPVRVTTLNNFTANPEDMSPENVVAWWMQRILNTTPVQGWSGDPVFESAVNFLRQRPSDESYPSWPRDKAIPREDLEENSWPYRWHERLRGTLSLLLASPYFMQR
ncbi:DUF1800 domain-containing protein [Marinicella sp. S1101]|uniref:DUF1800 domain-containing protein n=1 Tax=Marinicella marina TaxID=2996016 RepID=UPI002260BE17|nr:DUF1800 domain-containing protein [Marinicella marina]MCX7553559.1 DUF1800 domain-containing protein [Marinicella marina]MDJ1140183.1 DUF1800 domain-containing protein [Marinicella marina]